MPEIHAARRERARQKIAEGGADAALITAAPNVRYLSGLASSNAALLLLASGPAVLATDSRYALAAQRDCPDLDLVIERFIEPRLAAEMTRRALRTVAFEAHEMSVERHAELAAKADGVTTVPFGRRIEELRTAKDPSELELLATACRISGQAIADVFALIRPGLTERQLAAALDRRMVDLGAERPAFDTIVASGPNGAIPHHAPTDRPLRRGDLITMDFGALYGGYHADMTRTVALGEPTGWQREIYDLVAAAQRSGIQAARPGADVADVDAAARDLIRAAGHGEHFGHGLGHGVGLEVHEAPTIGYRSPLSLVSTCPAGAVSGSRTFLSWGPTGRACSRRPRENFSSFYQETERGHHERPEERHDLEHRRRALDRRGVPARQARQGPCLCPHQAEERHLGQGDRPDLQRRRQGRRGDHRPPRDAVPVPRGPRLRVHGHAGLRPAPGSRLRGRRRRELPAGGADRHGRVQRRPAAVRGHARGRRADHQPDRPRRAGRPLDRRHQAGHARDRRHGPGPAVHLHRGEDQGRHQDRSVPRPRLMNTAASRARS